MTTDEVRAMARQIAARYKRRCWWASFEDLEQEAAATILAAHESYLKHPEGDERGYAWKAAAYQLRNSLLRASAPVSASSHKLDELRGLVRASLDDVSKSGTSIAKTEGGTEVVMRRLATQDAAEPADDALVDHQWLQRVRTRLRDVLATVPNSTAAREVLYGYLSAHAAAAEAGLPVRVVYRAAKQARQAIGSDAQLYRLVQERVKG